MYLPGMKDRGWGRIVFISSESAINTPGGMIHYGMSKTAQWRCRAGWPSRAPGRGDGELRAAGGRRSQGRRVRQSAQRGQTVRGIRKSFFKTVRPTSLLKNGSSRPRKSESGATCAAHWSATNGRDCGWTGALFGVLLIAPQRHRPLHYCFPIRTRILIMPKPFTAKKSCLRAMSCSSKGTAAPASRHRPGRGGAQGSFHQPLPVEGSVLPRGLERYFTSCGEHRQGPFVTTGRHRCGD